MSIHKSFKTGRNKSKRTVRKRWERLQSLVAQGIPVVSAHGLPKEKLQITNK